jgi:hypothetical protein
MPARCAIACGVGSTVWRWLAEGQLDKRRTQPPGPQPAGPGAPAGAAFALCSPQRRISPRHEPPPTAGAVGGPSPARMLPLPLGGAERLAGGDGQAGPWDRNHPRVCRHRERAASPHYQQSCPPCPTKISPWEMPGWRLSRVNPLGRFASIKLAGEGPQVVAGDNLGAATRKVSHPATRSPISTEFS